MNKTKFKDRQMKLDFKSQALILTEANSKGDNSKTNNQNLTLQKTWPLKSSDKILARSNGLIESYNH